VAVWLIASHDGRDQVEEFAAGLGLEMPVLFDDGAVVFDAYGWVVAFEGSGYPQDWIIDAEGAIRYSSGSYDPEALRYVLDDLLNDP
jgi:peroxiredoxin